MIEGKDDQEFSGLMLLFLPQYGQMFPNDFTIAAWFTCLKTYTMPAVNFALMAYGKIDPEERSPTAPMVGQIAGLFDKHGDEVMRAAAIWCVNAREDPLAYGDTEKDTKARNEKRQTRLEIYKWQVQRFARAKDGGKMLLVPDTEMVRRCEEDAESRAAIEGKLAKEFEDGYASDGEDGVRRVLDLYIANTGIKQDLIAFGPGKPKWEIAPINSPGRRKSVERYMEDNPGDRARVEALLRQGHR